jgi:hypothetical protein
MRRSSAEWEHDMEAFLDGIESELRPSPPAKVQATLQAFRKRLERDRIGRRRKRFERDLESALQANPFLRRATERYLAKSVPAAMASALETLDRAERVLKQFDKPKKPVIN